MAAAPDGLEDFYLDVTLNGVPLNIVANFKRRRDGRLAATRAELTEIGLRSEAAPAGARGLVDLDAIPGLVYGIDPATQAILIDASDDALVPHAFDLSAHGNGDALAELQTTKGAVVNYTLFGSSDADLDLGDGGPVLSGQFDGRVYGGLGVLSQSGIVGSNFDRSDNLLRLDTAWTYSDPTSLRSWRGGDLVTGSLPWTRSVRLGGIQLRRNFGLRPDLVTMPAPAFSGSAAVPSSVEVYANNVRVFSEALAPGPFSVNNVPVVSGGGEARLVVQDALGRRTETSLPFYASSELLRAGLTDYALEIGFPRGRYGVRSNDYSGQPAASASIRSGVADRLTVEGHAEGTDGVFNAGAGAVLPLGGHGLASAAASGSAGDGTGANVSGSIALAWRGVQISARASQSFGQYDDIASKSPQTFALDPFAFDTDVFIDSLRPPKAVRQATLSFPLIFDPSRVSLSYVDLETADGERSRTLGLAWDRNLFDRATLFATSFVSLERDRDYGLFVGLAVPFGSRHSTEVSVSGTRDHLAAGVEAVRSETTEPGSVGWRVRDREGEQPDRLAAVSYRGGKARVAAGVQQFGGTTRMDAELGGSIVMAGGGVFLAPRVDDAFAVVDTGVPGVQVLHANRPVGMTDRRGKLLVTGLNAYDRNALAIDPTMLPVDADIARTSTTVVPADRSGAVAAFGVSTDTHSALVAFRDAAGQALPAGAEGRTLASNESFVVGYDGEAFLKGLAAENPVEIALGGGATCRANFPYASRPGAQVRIEDVRCAPTPGQADVAAIP